MRLDSSDTVFALIDIQERLCAAVSAIEPQLPKVEIMLRAADALNIPVIVSEQYPRGLGNTISGLKELFRPEWPIIEKTDFSCWGSPEFRLALEGGGIRSVVLMGIESHVCVQQTAFDLLEAGFQVVVAADTVASRDSRDCETALALMRASGIRVTTVESILFALMRTARHPAFKTVSALIR